MEHTKTRHNPSDIDSILTADIDVSCCVATGPVNEVHMSAWKGNTMNTTHHVNGKRRRIIEFRRLHYIQGAPTCYNVYRYGKLIGQIHTEYRTTETRELGTMYCYTGFEDPYEPFRLNISDLDYLRRNIQEYYDNPRKYWDSH